MIEDVQFDDIDERIVSAFQRNGRLSNRAVGRELGISEGLVRKRMKRLVDAGAVSYGLLVDVKATEMEAHGWMGIRAAPAQTPAVADAISRMRLCSLAAVMSGDENIRAYVYATDATAMAATIEEISAMAGVLGVTFRQVMTHTQHRYEYVIIPRSAAVEPWSVQGGRARFSEDSESE